MARYCRQFYCDQRGDRICCADCYLRKDCGNPCLNHPSRCNLEDKTHKPIARRGGKAKLLPKGYYKDYKDK